MPDNIPDFTIEPLPVDLIVALANADSAAVTSMKRYLPYTSPKSDKGEGEYDVVYEVICVVRNSNNIAEKEPTRYVAAYEAINKWYRIAIATWEGEAIPAEEENFWERSIEIEPRIGASNVTIFGNIVDKEGRFITLTITDQDKMTDVTEYVARQMWLYNETSKLVGGDISPFGTNPNNIRKTTVVDQEMRKNTRFDKPISNALPAPTQSIPEPVIEAIYCESISDLRALPKDALFKILIGRAVYITPRPDDKGMIVLNGFSMDATNNPILEVKENIFMHGNRNGFDLLIEDFAKAGYPIAAGEEIHIEKPYIMVTGIKRIGTSGKAFYDKLRIQ